MEATTGAAGSGQPAGPDRGHPGHGGLGGAAGGVQAYVAQLENLIPRSEQVAALLNADLCGGSADRGERPGDATRSRMKLGAFYTKESYEIEVTGEYHDIGRFLTTIASLPQIITSSGLSIVP